ncbi:unnamed protein product [Symbiodinium natans]|uniref:Uncharacterized protein n=1 Tax=Symbiodinium natans TaxID=878477 RepID=A0A812P2P1_9DINO|nr:unnamed protein product [Symbiodinium natans]
MQQEVGMRTFEARLSRNLWNREAQKKFYGELGKVYEQQALKLHEMRLSYYRELDHLRDQLGLKCRGRTFTMMEDVHFFNPEAYRIPTWREIADVLEVERRPVGTGANEKLVKYVPIHVLCKACRAKFSDDVIQEPKDVGVQAPEPAPQEECECSGEPAAGTEEPEVVPLGISRWAQTDLSMAQEGEMESRASQTEPLESTGPVSSGAAEALEAAEDEESPAAEAEEEFASSQHEADVSEEPALGEEEFASNQPEEYVPAEEELASGRHEASLEARTAGVASAKPARHGHGRASAERKETFDLVFDDFEPVWAADPDMEEPLPPHLAPRRQRRASEPTSRPGRQRGRGRCPVSLLDVPDVPTSMASGSDAEGIGSWQPDAGLDLCPDELLGVGGVQLQRGVDHEERSDSDTESLGLPLTLEEGLHELASDEGEASTESADATTSRESAEGAAVEGPTSSRSSALATSQIQIRLDASHGVDLRDSRPLVRGQVLADSSGCGAGQFPWEGRESASQTNAFRSSRRRPSLDPATPEPRRRQSAVEAGTTLVREPTRARRASSKDASCASCPLSGFRPGRGEQQIRIRSFNFEMGDATGSVALEDTRRPSPRTTFLPRVQVPKAKELEAKVSLEADRGPLTPKEPPPPEPRSDRSCSPVSSENRSLSPLAPPASLQMPVRPAPAAPHSARGRHRRTSLTVPCSRAPATSMSLISGEEPAESPHAPTHRGFSTSLDLRASGPAESVGSGEDAASMSISEPPGASSSLPVARDRRFPSLLTATTTRPKTEQSPL